MILKFKSNALWGVFDPDKSKETDIIIPAYGWTWLADVDQVKLVETVDLPVDGGSDRINDDVWNSYGDDHFADSHWVGINPNVFNKYSDDNIKREGSEYQMCYVKRHGKTELLAIGFLAEVYLLNDAGNTIDKIENPHW